MSVAKTDKLDELIDGAEELLIKLGDAYDPEIQMLRDRVDQAVRDARCAIAKQSGQAPVRLRDIASTIDDYIRDYPWLAVATGILAAGTVAFIAGAVVGNKRSSARGGR
jgi:ElaB/YqjD/DUF883 family membrane-anchored ribosome-binding protein